MTHDTRPNASVLVLFSDDIPRKGAAWWRQFDTIIAPEACAKTVRERGLSFVSIDDLIDGGNVQEASKMLGELAHTKLPDGSLVSKSVLYEGYELWWIHYNDLLYKFCMPYTEYSRLLEHVKDFRFVSFYKPPAGDLFRYFLDAYACRYRIIGVPSPVPSLGTWLQGLLSLVSFLVLVITRPKLMLWTSDLFDPPRDHDFRMRFIYEELYTRKLPFVEFIRSLESTSIVLAHALRRRRPVIYSHAVCLIVSSVARLFTRYAQPRTMPNLSVGQHFQFLLSTHYLRDRKADIWSIRTMAVLLTCIGVRSAIIDAATSRTFHEVLGCKLSSIPTTGILHGAVSRAYYPSDFMPEYTGTKSLSLDAYGVWSPWWKEFYVAHSKVYTPEQLHVSGPMRPLVRSEAGHAKPPLVFGRPIQVVFVAEQLAAPAEIIPYLSALLIEPGIDLYIKFRSYRDGFERWLQEHRLDILEQMDSAHILHGSMGDAIALADVVVGSHSTGVLEALLSLKPPVFFYTPKWGDYYDLRSRGSGYNLYADDPQELIRCIMESTHMPREILEELQLMFFGDPYMNGSRWVVERAASFL